MPKNFKFVLLKLYFLPKLSNRKNPRFIFHISKIKAIAIFIGKVGVTLFEFLNEEDKNFYFEFICHCTSFLFLSWVSCPSHNLVLHFLIRFTYIFFYILENNPKIIHIKNLTYVSSRQDKTQAWFKMYFINI